MTSESLLTTAADLFTRADLPALSSYQEAANTALSGASNQAVEAKKKCSTCNQHRHLIHFNGGKSTCNKCRNRKRKYYAASKQHQGTLLVNSASTPPAATADQLSNATHSDSVLESSIGGAHSISCEQPLVVKLEQTVKAEVKAEGLNLPKMLSKSEAPTARVPVTMQSTPVLVVEIRSEKRQKTKMLDSDSSDSFLKSSFDIDVALGRPDHQSEKQSAAAVSDAALMDFPEVIDLCKGEP